jgi:hypothetical protein
LKFNQGLSSLEKDINAQDLKLNELGTGISKEFFVQRSKLDLMTSEVNLMRQKVSEMEFDLISVKTRASTANQVLSSPSRGLAVTKTMNTMKEYFSFHRE